MYNEIAVVSFSSIVAILLSISIFIGNDKDKFTLKTALLMLSVGAASSIICWSYLQDSSPIKIIVRSVLTVTFLATTLSKLISRIIIAATSISKDRLQQLMVDYTRKKFGLDAEIKEKEKNE